MTKPFDMFFFGFVVFSTDIRDELSKLNGSISKQNKAKIKKTYELKFSKFMYYFLYHIKIIIYIFFILIFKIRYRK